MRICFLVGSMSISGGTNVIVQHASYLRKVGHDVTLAVQEFFSDETLAWHDEASNMRCVPIDMAKTESFDLVIATWWKTAFVLAEFEAGRYAYFVQSIETRFYPEHEIPLRTLVDATYKLPVLYVTEAAWIQKHLQAEFGHQVTLVRNGIRKDIFSQTGKCISDRPTQQPRVLVEGHFGVRFKNTALAVNLAKKAGATDVWLLTGSPLSWLPGVSRIFSRVPMQRTAEIYRSCDILIKLSTVEGMFGPPLEIFHCGGTAIVFDVSGHDEYIKHNENALVVPIGKLDGVVEALRGLLNERNELNRLQRCALRTAESWPSWEVSSKQFAEWVEHSIELRPVHRDEIQKITISAFNCYELEEGERIRKNPAVIPRYRLSALTSKFPGWFVRRLKALEAIGEVVFDGRKAY